MAQYPVSIDVPLKERIASTSVTEIAYNQTGTINTLGTYGAVYFTAHWRDSSCTASDTTTLWCKQVLSYRGKNAARYGMNGQERDNDIYGEGNTYTAQYWEYDARLGRRWNLDPVIKHHESPYSCLGNNPCYYTDPFGDSIIKFVIAGEALKFIHGAKDLYIDHTIIEDVKKVISAAVETKTHIRINSSFRTLLKQASSDIQKSGVTPASTGNSPHNAGLGIDFNLYHDNNPDKGTIGKNKGVTSKNSWLAAVKKIGWRVGADFKHKDPVHIDSRDSENGILTDMVEFQKMVKENQAQMHGQTEINPNDKYVKRTITATLLKNGNWEYVDNSVKAQVKEVHKVPSVSLDSTPNTKQSASSTSNSTPKVKDNNSVEGWDDFWRIVNNWFNW